MYFFRDWYAKKEIGVEKKFLANSQIKMEARIKST